LNTFFINLHSICFNWIWIQFNLIFIQSLNWIQLKLNWIDFKFIHYIWIQIQFKLHCNVIHASISYRNELVSLISRIFRNFSCSTRIFLVSFLFYDVILGANKEYLLCVTHCIISSLPFDWNSFISRSFQHAWHWHMNMCCLIRVHVNMLILFKGLLTKVYRSMQKGIMK
jgi:hypothetical protein